MAAPIDEAAVKALIADAMQIAATSALSPQDTTAHHTNSDVDSKLEALHHTTGMHPYQHSPGNHRHDGKDSILILLLVVVRSISYTYDCEANGTFSIPNARLR